MSEKETQQVKEAQEITSASDSEAAGGAAAEAANQLNDFVQRKTQPMESHSRLLQNLDNFNVLSEKARTEAIANIGKGLETMVVGDIPQLRKRLEELGVSTKELEEKEAKLKEKVEAAKPVQDAILKGDVKALQKMVAGMKPEQLTEITELIQKHFDQMGLGIEVDFTEGKLILSGTKADRAVLIAKDKLDVIGVNADGSYDFARHFRRENPAAELTQLTDGALTRYMFPPRNWGYKDMTLPNVYLEGARSPSASSSSSMPNNSFKRSK